MTLIERNRCVLTGRDDLEHLYTFPDFPVFMGCSDQPIDRDLREDMSWWISRDSGFIQLKKLLPLNVLYPESHGAGSVGALWQRHHREFASFVRKTNPRAVLEIGGAHGILEIEYRQLDDVPWTILEPNPSPAPGCRARFIKGFFDDSFTFSDSYDTLVHSHVFEHIYNPTEFMRQLYQFAIVGTKMVFSLPNMEVMLKRRYTNCINFEHTVFLTEPYIEYLLSKFGFELLEKKYFMEDHSIFYSTIRKNSQNDREIFDGLYEKNKSLYKDYINYHLMVIEELNYKINQAKSPVYLFGAHVFSQYLIEMGLRTDKIVCLLDNDANKQGRRLYGTKLKVSSPEILSKVDRPVVILRAGVYNNEIKRDIIHNINKSTFFLE